MKSGTERGEDDQGAVQSGPVGMPGCHGRCRAFSSRAGSITHKEGQPMKRLILAIAVVLAVAVPASASASTLTQVTATIKRDYTQQVKARTNISGNATFIGDTMKCASIGFQHFTCYATVTFRATGEYVKYGQFINVTASSWETVGKAILLKSW